MNSVAKSWTQYESPRSTMIRSCILSCSANLFWFYTALRVQCLVKGVERETHKKIKIGPNQPRFGISHVFYYMLSWRQFECRFDPWNDMCRPADEDAVPSFLNEWYPLTDPRRIVVGLVELRRNPYEERQFSLHWTVCTSSACATTPFSENAFKLHSQEWKVRRNPRKDWFTPSFIL